MKSIKSYLLLVSTIAIVIFACRKGFDTKEEKQDFAEYRSWMKQKGGIFSKDQIILGNQSGSIATGKLDWSQAIKSIKGANEILVVPFLFSQSAYKNGKIYNDVIVGELPSIYHLMITKDKSGLFEGRLRARAYIRDPIKGKRIFNNWYKLSGEYLCAYLTENDGNKYPLYLTDGNARFTTGCEVTSTTARYIECTGGMDNTVCTYFSRTTHRYHCPLGGTGVPEEVQNFQIDENGGGWYEYENSETVYENQRIIDSLQGYPCGQDVLKGMPNANAKTDSILNGVFGVSTKVNVIFLGDGTLPMTVNGKTVFDRTTFQTDGTINFFIGLNTYMLLHSAKELIAKTMIHESVHAYIGYYWLKYTNGEIDSTNFKTMFPLVWQYQNKGEAQHTQMALSYLDVINGFVRSYSASVSDSVSLALSWNGLTRTQAWRNLGSDTMRMLQIYEKSKYGTAAEMQNLGLRKCP